MDIVGEGVELLMKLAKELNRDNWPQVIRDLGVSGEFSRIAEVLKSAVSQDDQAGRSGLRQEPQEPIAPSSVPSDLTPDVHLQTPPTQQQKRHDCRANPNVMSLLRAPLPDFTEQTQALQTNDDPPEPTSWEQVESKDPEE